jgi:hypothetical protein
MADQLNPTTGLEKTSTPPPIVIKKSNLNVGANLTEAKISPMRELIKPVDLASTIHESADSKKVQLLKPADFISNDYGELISEYETNLQAARNSYLKQLDDEQNKFVSGTYGVLKFAGKTINNVASGLLGLGWGLVSAIATGDVNQLVDNSVYRAGEAISAGLDAAMPIYSDNPNYHGLSFWDKLTTEPGKLFGDEVSDALAFTAGAIGQEIILTAMTASSFGAAAPIQAAGTLGIAARGARILNKGLKALKAPTASAKVAQTINNLETAAQFAKTANTIQKFGGTAASLTISSWYEAAMEGRGTKDSYVQLASEKFMQENGREPNEFELETMEKQANSAMWTNHFANLAILSTSHLAQFNSIFLKASKVKLANNKVNNLISSSGGKLAVDAPKTVVGKVGKYAYLTVANPLTESLEELSQSISSEGALNYWSKVYDPEVNKESIWYLNSLIEAGGEYLGTNEAGNAAGIGFLVGMIGMPMSKKLGGYSGGVYGEIKSYNQSLAKAKEIVEKINSSPDLVSSLVSNYHNHVRATQSAQEMDSAAEANDMHDFKNAEHDYLFSYIKNRVDLGLYEDLTMEFEALEKMSLEDFNANYKIEGISEFTQEDKNKAVKKAKDFAADVQKYTEIVDEIIAYKGTNDTVGKELSNTIVHLASSLKNADIREAEMIQQLEELVGITEADVANYTKTVYKGAVSKKIAAIAKAEREGKPLTKDQEKYKKNVLKNGRNKKALELYNTLKKDTELSVEEIANQVFTSLEARDNSFSFTTNQKEFIESFNEKLNNASAIKADDVINKQKAQTLINDLAKIKSRREQLALAYEFLTTDKGIEALKKASEEAMQNTAKAVQEDIDNKAKKAATQAQDEFDNAYTSTISADASPEAQSEINAEKEKMANRAAAKDTTRPEKFNLVDFISNRWSLLRTDPNIAEKRALFEKEKELFFKQFDGRFGISKASMGNIIMSNILKDAIYRALDNNPAGEFAEELIQFFNKIIDDAISNVDVDAASAMNEDIDVETPSTFSDAEGYSKNFQPVYAPPSPYTSQGAEHELIDDGEKWVLLLDENGFPIPTENFAQIDFKYVNENLKEGDTVSIEVKLANTINDSNYSKNNRNSAKLQLVYVHTDASGNKHIVSTVPAYSEELNKRNSDYSKLKAMREDVFNKLIADGYLTKDYQLTPKGEAAKDTLIASEYVSTIFSILPGRLLINPKSDFKPAEEVLKEAKQPFVIGIAVNTNHGMEVQFPNTTEPAIKISDKIAPGSPLALITDKRGRKTVALMRTSKVSPQDASTAVTLLSQMSTLDLTTEEGKADLTTLRNQLNQIVYFTKEQIEDALRSKEAMDNLKNSISNKYSQISKYNINKGDFNSTLGNKLQLPPLNGVSSRNFVVFNFNKVAPNASRQFADTQGGVFVSPATTSTPTSTTQSTEAKKDEIERSKKILLSKEKNIKIGRYTPSARFSDRIANNTINLEVEDALSAIVSFTKGPISQEQVNQINEILDLFYPTLTKNQIEALIYKYKKEVASFTEIIEGLNRINAKYDAELKALESTPQAGETNTDANNQTPLTPSSATPLKKLGNSTKTGRKLFKLKDGKTGKLNTKAALDWLSKALPEVPVTVLNQYVKILNDYGAEAWGVFKNSGIEFLENAPEGVPYHEAFHAIFGLYTSDVLKIELLTEAQARTGLNDDLELEEWLADRFADYMIAKFEDKSLGKKILDFFKNLLKSLRILENNRLDDIFREMSQSVYKSSNKIVTTSRFKNKDGFTVNQRHNRIAMLTDSFVQIINSVKAENPDKSINNIINNYIFNTSIIKGSIFNQDKEYTDVIQFKGVKAIFAEVYAGISDMLNDAIVDRDSPDTLPEVRERRILAIEQLGMLLDNFWVEKDGNFEVSDIVLDAASALRKNHIKVSIKQNAAFYDATNVEDIIEDEEANLDENDSLENWMINSAKLSIDDTASWVLKYELSNIDVTEGFDDIGYPIKYDGDVIIRTLKREMSDKLDIGEMKAHLWAHIQSKPYYANVLSMLENNPQFEAAFVNAFTTNKIVSKLLIKSVGENDEVIWSVVDAKSKDNSELLMDAWDVSFNTIIKNLRPAAGEAVKKTPEQIFTSAKAKLESLISKIEFGGLNLRDIVTETKGLRIATAREISDILSEIGIDVLPDNIKAVFDDAFFSYIEENGFTANAIRNNHLISSLKSDILPFTGELVAFVKNKDINALEGERSPFKTEKKTLTTFSKLVGTTMEEVYEGSYSTADGEKRMVNTIPNHLVRLLLQFKANKNNILNEYLSDPFYKRNLWLRKLKEGGTGNNFSYQEVGGIKSKNKDDGKTYFNLSPRDKIITSLLNFWGNINSTTESKMAWYESPILADMSKLPLISMEKYDINEVVSYLMDVYKQETTRIENVKREQATLSENELIEFYHYGYDSNGNRDLSAARGLMRHYISVGTEAEIKKLLDNEVEKYKAEIKQYSVNTAIGNVKYTTDEFIKRFVYNDFLAKINMNQLFNGDSAFYKTDTDLSKRTSQLGKPGSKLSTTNIPTTYKTVYFEDVEVDVNEAYNDIIESAPKHAQKGLKKALTGIVSTDAQAFISIERWKQIIDGQGLFKGEYVKAYDAAVKGEKLSPRQMSLIMQPIKPFYYGKHLVGNKIVPVQNKNSEYVILPSMKGSNPNVDKILDLFDKGISSVQFHSAVKVGATKLQNLETIDTSDVSTYAVELSNENYVIQTAVPEHHMDTTVLYGTQIRKLIISNLKDTTKHGNYTINGKSYSREGLLKLYMDTINENLIEDSIELDAFFEKNTKLVEILTDEVRDRGLSKKYLKTLALDSQGEFVFPLFFPLTSKKAESLISSLFANRITKQKIKGGSFVQVSDIISSKNLSVKRDPSTGAIIEMEAMMPWTSAQYMPLNAEGEVDIAYIQKHTPELLEAVGFRIPTEDKYSMPVIKIVGFLPQHSGGAIMLPADFVALSGSDFDVDKLFVMMKEFKSTNEHLKKEYNLQNYQIEQLRSGELYIAGASEFIKGKGTHYIVESGPSTKESRNNLLIDITKGILRDAYHAKEIINPGSFERYKALRNQINTLMGVSNEETFNINLPTKQLELFKRNTAGKALIGIFANHNVNHALVQHVTGLSVPVYDKDGNPKSFIFENDGQVYELDGTVKTETDGEYTSRFLAELLAAAVDNAKDPVLSSLNINTYTADLVAYMLRTGLSPELTMLFINQPVIKAISQYHFNNGENNMLTRKYIKNLRKEYPNKDKLDKLLSKHLKENIQKTNTVITAAVLDFFVGMSEASKQLSDITQAMRADAKPSKNMTANRIFLEKYDALPNSLKSANSPVSMVHYFTELGIRKANNTLSKYFPWTNNSFIQIKNALTSNKGYSLSEKEEEFVNQVLVAYLSKDYELFNLSKKEKLDLYNNLSTEVDNTLINELPNNKFLKNLKKSKVEHGGVEYKLLGIDNFNTYSELQKEALEESFMELYEAKPELAKKLVQYAYMTNGLAYSRNSFVQLLPVDIFTSIKDESGFTYQDFLKIAVESNIDVSEFLNIFYKHYADKFDFVKEIKDYEISSSKQTQSGLYLYIGIDITKQPFYLDVEYIKDSSGNLYRAYMEKGNTMLYLPIPKLGAEGILFEPNSKESLFPANDVLIQNKITADQYQFNGKTYAVTKIGDRVKINSTKNWVLTEELGTFASVNEILPGAELIKPNKLFTKQMVLTTENYEEYIKEYLTSTATPKIEAPTEQDDYVSTAESLNQSTNKLTNQDIETLFNTYSEQINNNLKIKEGLFAVDITLEDFKQLAETVNTKEELEEFIKKCYSI